MAPTSSRMRPVSVQVPKLSTGGMPSSSQTALRPGPASSLASSASRPATCRPALPQPIASTSTSFLMSSWATATVLLSWPLSRSVVQLTRPATPRSVPFLITSSSGSRLPPSAPRMLSVQKPATASPVRSAGVAVAARGALREVGDRLGDELLGLLAGLGRVEHDGRLGAGDAHEVADRDEQRAVGGAGRGQRRHGAVHVGGEDVDGAGGDRHLLVQPVAGEARRRRRRPRSAGRAPGRSRWSRRCAGPWRRRRGPWPAPPRRGRRRSGRRRPWARGR